LYILVYMKIYDYKLSPFKRALYGKLKKRHG
jgi:hypothetical protein